MMSKVKSSANMDAIRPGNLIAFAVVGSGENTRTFVRKAMPGDQPIAIAGKAMQPFELDDDLLLEFFSEHKVLH